MWEKIAVFILRYRWTLIISLVGLTALMAYKAKDVKFTYDNPKFIPDDDKEYQAYQDFKKTFGDDGSVLVIGIKTPLIHNTVFFNEWTALSEELENTDGIQGILSISNVPNLTRTQETNIIGEDTFEREVFFQERIINGPVKSQEELDSLLGVIKNLKFYEGIIFQENSDFTILAITLEKEILDSKKRIPFVRGIVKKSTDLCEKYDVEAHISGLPFIRTEFSQRIKEELRFFTILSLIITSLILLFFFRSFYTLIFSLLVVIIGVIWSFGILELLGYKITMFMALLPPLIVVIGIANCIYLLNKYHDEYRTHTNQMRALQRVVSKVGIAVFFTNLTTGIGFGVFQLTGSSVLQEFGLTAFLSVMSVFLISIILIPVIFSFLKPPSIKHTKHLDNKRLNRLIEVLSTITTHHRKWVYYGTIIVVLAAFYGMSQVKAIGYMVDDISKSEKIYKDLVFFEENMKGIMPFEIVIDTKTPGAINDPGILRKIDRFERQKLSEFEEFSKPVSIAQVINFARQSLNGGDSRFYRIPGNLELTRIMNLMPSKKSGDGEHILRSLVDSTNQKARISVQMADVGSKRIRELKEEIYLIADTIFNYDKIDNEIFTDSVLSVWVDSVDASNNDTTYYRYYETSYEKVDSAKRVDVTITGTSVIFQKGNDYLINNLLVSLAVAFLIIGLIMATLFISLRMIVISLIPNVIPLLITAGIMGYFNVALKPSTVLVFSVAFGIAVDFTIHFLSKYRMELNRNQFNIQVSVAKALKETGVSMIYTSVILFFGFIIFSASSFGGTIALGVFTSITLVVALLCNLLVLPSLLLSYDLAKIRQESKKKPIIDYPDEVI
jgi:predicted RND superfamily exporter protein